MTAHDELESELSKAKGAGFDYDSMKHAIGLFEKHRLPNLIAAERKVAVEERDKHIASWLNYDLKEFMERCGVCGGQLVRIRGRYPRDDKRVICPTCVMERQETVIDNLTQNEAMQAKLTEPGETQE